MWDQSRGMARASPGLCSLGSEIIVAWWIFIPRLQQAMAWPASWKAIARLTGSRIALLMVALSPSLPAQDLPFDELSESCGPLDDTSACRG